MTALPIWSLIMASKLTTLPPELILEIASSLSTVELGSLRGTCRYIESALFNTFAHEFFSIRWVPILPNSVENLVEISRHPQLSQQVVEVKICCEWIADSLDANVNDERQLQLDFLESGDWKSRLGLAFRNLPNCRTVQIRDQPSLRRRPREGSNWRGWGVKVLEDEGFPFNQYVFPPFGPYSISASDVLETAVEANLLLRDFSMITRTASNASTHDEWNQPLFRTPSAARLDSLKTLMLCCVKPNENWENIRPFFEALVNLRVLRLNHDEYGRFDVPYHIQSNSTTGNDLYDIIGDVFRNRSLKSLQIGKLNTTQQRLTRLIESLNTLENLYLFRIVIHSTQYGGTGGAQLLDSLQRLQELREVILEHCIEDESRIIWKPSSEVSDIWNYEAPPWPNKIVFEKQPHNPIDITELKGRMVIESEELREQVYRTHREEQNLSSGSDYNHESAESTDSDSSDD